MLLFFSLSLLVPAHKAEAAEYQPDHEIQTFLPAVLTSGTSSGVDEVDELGQRTLNLVDWLCHLIGILVATVSLIFFFISLASHQAEMRNMALIGFFVGLLVTFAVPIVLSIVG